MVKNTKNNDIDKALITKLVNAILKLELDKLHMKKPSLKGDIEKLIRGHVK